MPEYYTMGELAEMTGLTHAKVKGALKGVEPAVSFGKAGRFKLFSSGAVLRGLLEQNADILTAIHKLEQTLPLPESDNA